MDKLYSAPQKLDRKTLTLGYFIMKSEKFYGYE